MRAYFVLKEIIPESREVIKHREEINVTSWDDPTADPIVKEIKSEEIILKLTLVSSGRTDVIPTALIIHAIEKRLGETIP